MELCLSGGVVTDSRIAVGKMGNGVSTLVKVYLLVAVGADEWAVLTAGMGGVNGGSS